MGERSENDAAIRAALDGPIAALDWERLWRGPGMPDVLPTCDAKPVEEARLLASKWGAAGSDASALGEFCPADIDGWSTSKLIVFLDALLDDSEDGGGRVS